jgi:hypothetical protein
MRGGGVPFIGIWKTSRWNCKSRPVHHTRQTVLGHTQKKSLSDDTIGVGPEHIRRRDGQVRWS